MTHHQPQPELFSGSFLGCSCTAICFDPKKVIKMTLLLRNSFFTRWIKDRVSTSTHNAPNSQLVQATKNVMCASANYIVSWSLFVSSNSTWTWALFLCLRLLQFFLLPDSKATKKESFKTKGMSVHFYSAMKKELNQGTNPPHCFLILCPGSFCGWATNEIQAIKQQIFASITFKQHLAPGK